MCYIIAAGDLLFLAVLPPTPLREGPMAAEAICRDGRGGVVGMVEGGRCCVGRMVWLKGELGRGEVWLCMPESFWRSESVFVSAIHLEQVSVAFSGRVRDVI